MLREVKQLVCIIWQGLNANLGTYPKAHVLHHLAATTSTPFIYDKTITTVFMDEEDKLFQF